MRLLALSLLSLLVLPGHAADTPSWFSAKANCSETSKLNDRRELTCTIPASVNVRKYRFTALFTGGHDDTSASIEPRLNDLPLRCDEGSKTSLFGEEGDVSVFCDFSASAMKSQAAVLKVLVKWNHAEYDNFDLLGD